MIKDRPGRLDQIFLPYPLYFVTFCTRNRRQISSLVRVDAALEEYGRRGSKDHNVALGRYVIMPDHVHLFVRGDMEFQLSPWVGGLKRALAVAAGISRLWQPGFFDHVVRSDESYSEKWNYVHDNPVRAGLVKSAHDWTYQGEVVVIDCK